MKKVYLFFMLVAFLLSGCAASPEEVLSAKTENKTPRQTPTPVKDEITKKSYLSEDEKLVDRSSEIQMVLTGNLQFKNGAISVADDWSIGEETDDGAIKKGIVFDVLTCAGFVGQAKLKEWKPDEGMTDKGYNWKVEFIPAKNKNSSEKCHDRNNLIPAFGIFPAKPSRQTIKIQTAPDLSEIFNTLSEKDKKWIASDDGESQNAENKADIETWTDSDGNGKIDLIKVKGVCNGMKDGELVCYQILHFSGNKWIRIGWLATD